MARRRLRESITIRLDLESARALREKARAQQRSASAIVRALIQSEVFGRPYVGAIRSGPVTQGRKARELLKGWKPDRRG